MLTFLFSIAFLINIQNVYSAELTLSKPVFDSTLRLSVDTTNLAGSIYSMTYRGVQYIDSYDHGRELQSASSFNKWGECFNPTEAGGSYNGRGYQPSSSVVLSSSVSGSTLSTMTNMAFWLAPGTAYGRPCTSQVSVSSAQNTTILSGHKLEKQVTVGVNYLNGSTMTTIPNALDFKINFHVPSVPIGNTLSQFEVLTGYMPPSFSLISVFDPINDQITPITTTMGEQPYPLVFMTSNQNHAMGVYSPDNIVGMKGPGYGRFVFLNESVVKWNVVFRQFNEAAVPGKYNFRVFVSFGTVQEVKNAMKALYSAFPNPTLKMQPKTTIGVYKCEKSNSSAFYTTWHSEGVIAGLNCGVTPYFNLYRSKLNSEMRTLYRCRAGSYDHFLSVSSSCEGQSYEGPMGFLYSTDKLDHSTLYRYFKPNAGHRVLLEGQAPPSGYSLEGILGWVP